jgi:hypothetical protein
MPNSEQLVVRSIANGATAQLRSVLDVADREEARRIYSELHRMSKLLQDKHGFVTGGTHQKRGEVALGG